LLSTIVKQALTLAQQQAEKCKFSSKKKAQPPRSAPGVDNKGRTPRRRDPHGRGGAVDREREPVAQRLRDDDGVGGVVVVVCDRERPREARHAAVAAQHHLAGGGRGAAGACTAR
jgi:hypothetical protein